MNTPQIYILVSLVVLAVVAILVFFVSGKGTERKLDPLASLAFAFIMAGLIFGENRFIDYGLMGVGLLLAVVDMYNKSKQK